MDKFINLSISEKKNKKIKRSLVNILQNKEIRAKHQILVVFPFGQQNV